MRFMHLRIMTSIAALLLPAITHGQANWLPGGDATRQAVEARRGNTELSKLAATMKPGTWAELKTDMPERLWSAPLPSKRLHIGTWSDDGQWDSRTGQFVYFGVRQTRKLVAYSEEKNAWRVIEFEGKENAPELLQRFGHQYSKNSLDPERSRYYTAEYRYDLLTDKWTQLPFPGPYSMAYEYFSAMNGLVSVASRPVGTLRFYSDETNAWSELGTIPVHGYHSLVRHNPFRQEVLFAGGNDSQAVALLLKDGTTKQLKDFPEPLTVRTGIVTVDPLSGRYLFVSPEKKFYELDSEKNEYRLLEDFSVNPWGFGRYDAPLVAYIPEYGVTMWADSKVLLYKHNATK